jgi:hypothetical protein
MKYGCDRVRGCRMNDAAGKIRFFVSGGHPASDDEG